MAQKQSEWGCKKPRLCIIPVYFGVGEESGPQARPPFGALAQPGSHVLTAFRPQYSFTIVNLSFLLQKNKCL